MAAPAEEIRNFSSSVKKYCNGDLFRCEDNMLFSRVKAHLVFPMVFIIRTCSLFASLKKYPQQ